VTQAYENCVDHDVKVRIVFSASISLTDPQTLHVCVQQGLKENSGAFTPNVCDESVDVSAQVCADLPPGASTNFNDGGLSIPDFATATWSVVISNTE
jgi:hypothetical protein